MTKTTPPCSYASPHQTYHPLNLPARASRGWLHMLQAMMSVLNVRSAGVTPCSKDNTGQMPFRTKLPAGVIPAAAPQASPSQAADAARLKTP